MNRTISIDGRLLAYGLLAALAGCSGNPGEPFGLARRIEVEGVTLPTGLAQPGEMIAVNAFPAVTIPGLVGLAAVPGRPRMAALEQAGRVHLFDEDAAASSTDTFLDITAQVLDGGEQGLLGIAFHPEYPGNGQFYLYYTAANPRRSILSRWMRSSGDPDLADASSEEILLEVMQPFGNHNGGTLAFGPDQMLYVSLGDGGSGNDPLGNGQDRTTLLGSILRLTPDGGIPADNPFVGVGGGVREEIWAYGIRNPWRMSFDRVTGDLWCGDVGQGAEEEIDVIRRGDNHGWPVFEGDRSNINPGELPATAFASPVISYGRSLGASVTGGYVYRGAAQPTLSGAYLYADFVSGRVWALVWDGAQVVSNRQITNVANPSTFGEGRNGEIYVGSIGGQVFRFEPTANGGGVAPGAGLPATLSGTGLFEDLATLAVTPGVIEYDVSSPLWSDGARKRRFMVLPGDRQIGFDAEGAWAFPIGTAFVKHFEIDLESRNAFRIETRVFFRAATGWEGHTYRWRDDQSEADLLVGRASVDLNVRGDGGVVRLQTWDFPSSADCTSCHTQASGRVLGVHTRQINRLFDYPSLQDNQLRAWNHVGLFSADVGASTQYPWMPNPSDPTASLEGRARAYLDANCANCHRPAGPTPVDLDLRYSVAVDSMSLFDVLATNPVDGVVGALRGLAGAREQSDLWIRLQRRDQFAMPPLGSNMVDREALDLVGEWIDLR